LKLSVLVYFKRKKWEGREARSAFFAVASRDFSTPKEDFLLKQQREKRGGGPAMHSLAVRVPS